MGRRIVGIVVALLLVLCFLAAVGGGLAYFHYGAAEEAKPVVFISSPAYGQQAEVGEVISVEALARDETKVTRVELWVDGVLETSQESSLPEGTSPFPLLATWQPTSPGSHTLIVRAFNAQNARAYASVNVEAVEGADEDGDGVADVFDVCPDEPGTSLAEGCPDADGDGVADGEDSCPDEPGLLEYDGCPMTDDRDLDGIADDDDECPDQAGTLVTEGCPDADGDTIPDQDDACPEQPGAFGSSTGDGCPASSATDRDGDGIPDEEDECPDEGGSPLTEGCPDGDGDGVRDADDECPDEPGLAGADGCQVPGGGEDSDGDGVLDVNDECPGVWGWPEYSGCPDSDRDGVPDPEDLRPEDAGPAETGGAPEMDGEDTDGDGVPDDVDNCDGEEGLAEHEGCPPPGAGEDGDEPVGSGLADLIVRGFGVVEEGGVRKANVNVEVEVLWFETDERYNNVYCYVGLAGGDMDRYTLSRLGWTRWDRLFDGQDSRIVMGEDTELFEIRMECGAYRTYLGEEEGWEEPPYDLGSVVVGHPVEEWDGTVFEVTSSGGEEGHSFYIKYRLCLHSCEAAALPAPALLVLDSGFGGHQLVWDWGGYDEDIAGFRLYVNGSFNGNSFDRDVRSWVLPESLEPTCTESLELQLTAFGPDFYVNPEQESPRSNSVVVEGPTCPRTVRVTFDQLDTFDLRDERRMDGALGPIFGGFWANDETLHFQGSDYPDGYTLRPWSTYSVQSIFDAIWNYVLGSWADPFSFYNAPDTNYVTVELGPDEDLTVGGAIHDQDSGMYQTVFNASHSIEPGELVPGPVYIRDQQIQLTVQIAVLVGPEAGSLPDLTIRDVTEGDRGQLCIDVFNNAADLVDQDVTVELVRLSTGEVIDTPTWPGVTIPSGGEVRLERDDLVLEAHDLRLTVDPYDDIAEEDYSNNFYETPVRMRVEFVQLRLPAACEGWADREAEAWFLFWVGYGPSEEETYWVGHRVRYPESGILEWDIPPAGFSGPEPWSLEGQERYSFGFEMPADENLYIMIAGYEHDPSREQPMGRIEVGYGPDANYGHSDEVYEELSSGPGTEDCEEWHILNWDYFGFEAQWRITRVY
jgi:hypothetical protein